MQLLQPVLTFGLLVLARLCLGMSLVMVEDEVEETVVGAGDGALCRCWLASSGAMLRRRAEIRRGPCSEQLPLPTVKRQRRTNGQRHQLSELGGSGREVSSLML